MLMFSVTVSFLQEVKHKAKMMKVPVRVLIDLMFACKTTEPGGI